MRNLLRKIVSTLVKWFQPRYKTEYKEELPEVIADKTIYFIGESNNPWLIAFRCPCGCKSIIHLNLLKNAKPHWSYYITSRKKVNIAPSVWRTKGCKSHFFVRKSKIDWVGSWSKSLW